MLFKNTNKSVKIKRNLKLVTKSSNTSGLSYILDIDFYYCDNSIRDTSLLKSATKKKETSL